MEFCVPVADLQHGTVRATAKTLDYVDARDQSLLIVGSAVSAIRVIQPTGPMVVPVFRRAPGPGIATWVNRSPTELALSFEALDAAGNVIPTTTRE